MVTVKARVKGITESYRYLNKVKNRMVKEVGHSVKKAGMATRDIAKELAPVGTGALITAIHYKSSKIRGGWHSQVISDLPGQPNWQGNVIPYNVLINEYHVYIPKLMPGGYVVMSDTWGMVKGSRDRRGYMNKAFEYAKEIFPKAVMYRVDMVLGGK